MAFAAVDSGWRWLGSEEVVVVVVACRSNHQWHSNVLTTNTM